MLTQFHFLRPWWLLLLLLLPPLGWWLSRRTGAAAALTRLVDASLLPHLLERHGRRQRWPLALPLLAGVLATLALAGPTWQRLPQALFGSQAAQVVALSLSQRMLARDVTPDRLTRARYKVHDLLAANADGENGLIAYAGETFVVAPLTTDAHALGNLLDALAPDVMPVPGDAPAKAIARGVTLLQQGGADAGSLVLVTDDATAAAVAAARKAHAAGVRVSVLGVGSRHGAPIQLNAGGFLKDAKGDIVMARRDDDHLRAVAAAGGGRYVPMTADHADIKALAAELRVGRGRRPITGAHADRWRDFGPWLLLPLLPLAALAFRRGWLLMLTFLLLPLWPVPGRAASPTTADHLAETTWAERLASLWLNADQRASRALAAGHAKRAQQLAHDPALRGEAAYRAGDYDAAARDFSAGTGSDAAYDRGNALARQRHYQEAIKAYTQALKLDPHNADAAANKKSVEDWLHQQKKQQKQQQGKGKQKKQQNGQQKQNQQHQKSGSNSSDGKGSKSSAKSGNPASPSSSSRPPSSPASSQRPASPSSAESRPESHAESSADAAADARDKAQADKAGKALKKQMDQALGKKSQQQAPYALGTEPASASSANRLPADMRQALQRVPDDPGGLLRRKFALEYQERNGGTQGDSQ